MAYNKKRTAKMKSKTIGELQQIVKNKTLSSAAATAELRKRGDASRKPEELYD